jgi:hypothetical protein
VDSSGRLVTAEWIRMEHDRCKETGWGYHPRAVNYELSPEVQAESAGLGQPTSISGRPHRHPQAISVDI